MNIDLLIDAILRQTAVPRESATERGRSLREAIYDPRAGVVVYGGQTIWDVEQAKERSDA